MRKPHFDKCRDIFKPTKCLYLSDYCSVVFTCYCRLIVYTVHPPHNHWTAIIPKQPNMTKFSTTKIISNIIQRIPTSHTPNNNHFDHIALASTKLFFFFGKNIFVQFEKLNENINSNFDCNVATNKFYYLYWQTVFFPIFFLLNN